MRNKLFFLEVFVPGAVELILDQLGLEGIINPFELAVQPHQIQGIGQAEEFYVVLRVPLILEGNCHSHPSLPDGRHHIPIVLVVVEQHDSRDEVVKVSSADCLLLHEELTVQVLR